jgi:hypothetical protein
LQLLPSGRRGGGGSCTADDVDADVASCAAARSSLATYKQIIRIRAPSNYDVPLEGDEAAEVPGT